MCLFTIAVETASANTTLEFHIVKNGALLEHFKIETHFSNANDLTTISANGIDPVVKGDRLSLAVENISNTGDLIIVSDSYIPLT